MRWMLIMLFFVPISILLEVLHANDTWRFAAACIAIIPLAGFIGSATEQLAKCRGAAVGGLLNATFGNATELIIAVVAVRNGQVDVVRASLIGSIIGNILLVVGLSALLGGFKYNIQTFNKDMASAHSSMMTIAVISFLVPALFVHNVRLPPLAAGKAIAALSLGVSAILIALYLGGLIFSLYTHKQWIMDGEEAAADNEPPTWSQTAAILVLAASTALIAMESEFLVRSIEPVVAQWHVSKLFLGIILIPIIGNAAEHSTAVVMALRNKMDITLNIAVSSATQIAMFVAPLVILASAGLGHPVTIVFGNMEIVAVAVAVVIEGQTSRDGKSHWLEGAQLLAVYAIIALAFYFVPS